VSIGNAISLRARARFLCTSYFELVLGPSDFFGDGASNSAHSLPPSPLTLSLSFVVVVSSFYFNTERGGASFLALLICLENLLSSNCSSVSIIMMQWCVVLKFAPHTSDAQFNTAINSGAFKSIREYVCTNDPAYLKSSLSSV